MSITKKQIPVQHLVFTLACLMGSAICIGVRFLRHDMSMYSSGFKFILGIAPNFGAVLAILFGIEIYYTILIKKTKVINSSFKEFGLIALVTGLGLVLWELLQFLFWNYPMDLYDLQATAAGIVFSTMLFLITRNHKFSQAI